MAHGLSLGGIVCEYIKDASGKVYLLSVLRTEWASNAAAAAAGGEMDIGGLGTTADLHDVDDEGEDAAAAALLKRDAAAAKFREDEAAFEFVEGQAAGSLRYGEDQQYMGTVAGAVHPDPMHEEEGVSPAVDSSAAATLFGLPASMSSLGRGQALDWAPNRALQPTKLSSPNGKVRHESDGWGGQRLQQGISFPFSFPDPLTHTLQAWCWSRVSQPLVHASPLINPLLLSPHTALTPWNAAEGCQWRGPGPVRSATTSATACVRPPSFLPLPPGSSSAASGGPPNHLVPAAAAQVVVPGTAGILLPPAPPSLPRGFSRPIGDK